MNHLLYIICNVLFLIWCFHTILSSYSDLTISLNIRNKEGVKEKSDSKKRDYVFNSPGPAEGLEEESFIYHKVPAKGLEEGFAEGEEESRAEGQAEGHARGLAEGHADGYVTGLTEGHATGLTEGHAEGYVKGLGEGQAKGHARGLAEGLAEGQAEAYDEGLAEGAAEGPEECPGENPSKEGLSEGCHCGIRNKKNNSPDSKGTEISQGTVTQPHEFPWQVALIDRASNKLSCGGSVISSYTILTAQHCTEGISLDTFDVLVGEHNTDFDGDGEMTYEIKEIINYNEKFLYNQLQTDFALIILNDEITWSNEISPICLPEGEPSSYEDVKAIITGWGSTEGVRAETIITSPILQKAEVNTMNNNACRKSKTLMDLNKNKGKNVTGILLANAICAFDPIQFPCVRDSGGPLVTKEEEGYYSQIGIVSWGYDHEDGICHSNEKTPAIFSRVTSQTPWIKKHLKGQLCAPPKKYNIIKLKQCS